MPVCVDACVGIYWIMCCGDRHLPHNIPSSRLLTTIKYTKKWSFLTSHLTKNVRLSKRFNIGKQGLLKQKRNANIEANKNQYKLSRDTRCDVYLRIWSRQYFFQGLITSLLHRFTVLSF